MAEFVDARPPACPELCCDAHDVQPEMEVTRKEREGPVMLTVDKVHCARADTIAALCWLQVLATSEHFRQDPACTFLKSAAVMSLSKHIVGVLPEKRRR